MRKNHKKILKTMLSVIISFALLNTLSIKVFAEENTQDSFSYGKQIIQKYYIDDVPDSKLNAATDMDSLVKSLNDPYSTYFTEQEYNDFVNSINNTFSGIGIQIDKTNEGVKVTSVFEKTPAMDAGIKTGDIIVKADNHDLSALSTEEAVKYIKGKSGTIVNLEVKRDGAILSFDVERKDIVLPTVEGEVLDNHIGYIKISSFGEKTSTEFENVLTELKKSAPDCYIVDLRNNGGGYMDVAFDIAGYFIGDNVVLNTQTKAGQTISYNATKQKELIDKPVIYLINGYSASASEILAAAVKDNKKAFFVGEKTYGKGVAQSIFTLPDNSYLKLTTLRFVSPLGNQINKVGVTPDMEIKDDNEKNIDSLNAARILFSNINKKTDKSGLAELNIAGKTFEINLYTAMNKENINTFKYMSPNLFVNANLNNRVGTASEKNLKNTEIKSNSSLKASTVNNSIITQEKVDSEVAKVSDTKITAKSNINVLPNKGSVNKYYFLLCIGSVFILSGVYLKAKKII